jgi:hypothetical protein
MNWIREGMKPGDAVPLAWKKKQKVPSKKNYCNSYNLFNIHMRESKVLKKLREGCCGMLQVELMSIEYNDKINFDLHEGK